MDISRPPSPPQDLWSSILDSVSSSRSIPSKQILVLGQPSSGKSTLVSALLHKALSDDQKDAQRTDFAIGYDFADVRDEADEGKYSRLKLQATICSESIRHSCSIVCIHSAFLWIVIYCSPAAFSTSSVVTTSYPHNNCPWLDAPLDICWRTTNMADLGRNVVKRRHISRARNYPWRKSRTT